MLQKKGSIKGKQQTPAKPKTRRASGAKDDDRETTKRPAQDDEEDDDDVEDDADLDMLLGGDDDEDEEDDNEEDEDEEDGNNEDDDDEEMEETESPKKQQIQSKQTTLEDKKCKAAKKNISKTPDKSLKATEKQPLKGAQKAVMLTKVASPKKVQQTDDKPFAGNSKGMRSLYEESKKNRDAKTLFVGHVPSGITVAELKALSNDILHVTLPIWSSECRRKNLFAFLEFRDESKAEENYALLRGKKLRDQTINVDYTGAKSKNLLRHHVDKNVNLKVLLVSSLPPGVTLDKVAQFFPKANELMFLTKGSAFSSEFNMVSVQFESEKDAADALKACIDAEIDGKPISVFYSISRDNRIKNRNKWSRKRPATKKMKFECSKQDDDDDE